MMPFLMVSAVRAPTVMAPNISKIVSRIIACRYVMDLDETLVAQELATSSIRLSVHGNCDKKWSELRTCSIIVGIEHGKQSANHKNVGVLVQRLERKSNIKQESD